MYCPRATTLRPSTTMSPIVAAQPANRRRASMTVIRGSLGVRDRAVRRQLVDRLRQHLREPLRKLLYRQAGFRGELLQQIRTDHLVNVVGRDGLIRSRADPRLHRWAEAVLLERVDHPL